MSERGILRGTSAAAVLPGAGLVGVAGLLPVRPAVPEPPTVVQGFDLRSGRRRWQYTRQRRCLWSESADAPVPARDIVLFGLVCGPLPNLLLAPDAVVVWREGTNRIVGIA